MSNLLIVAHCCSLLLINYFKHLEVKILHLQFRCEREPLLVFARNVTKSRKRVCCVFAIRLSTSTPSYPLDSAVNTCWYLYEPAAEQYGSYRCIGRWPCDCYLFSSSRRTIVCVRAAGESQCWSSFVFMKKTKPFKDFKESISHCKPFVNSPFREGSYVSLW